MADSVVSTRPLGFARAKLGEWRDLLSNDRLLIVEGRSLRSRARASVETTKNRYSWARSRRARSPAASSRAMCARSSLPCNRRRRRWPAALQPPVRSQKEQACVSGGERTVLVIASPAAIEHVALALVWKPTARS